MATNATAPRNKGATTHAPLPEKPAVVPDRATWIGRDDAGREHYQTGALPRGTVIVVDGGQIVDSVELPAREHTTDTTIATVPDWLEFVADRCGWSRRAGDIDLVGLAASELEGDR